jgi:hypothetical protein
VCRWRRRFAGRQGQGSRRVRKGGQVYWTSSSGMEWVSVCRATKPDRRNPSRQRKVPFVTFVMAPDIKRRSTLLH